MQQEGQVIECIPNFSEGRDKSIIDAISDSITSVEGTKLLHVDMGASANRTVITFAGPPDAVIEGAFRAIKTAAEKIDMQQHKGTHPRIGSTDVCPLVPIRNITMQQTVHYSRILGERVGQELDIPVFLYEESALLRSRHNLSKIRAGEYEGMAEKILQPGWAPDFGRAHFNARSGVTVIGARPFLVAYNINLNTKDKEIARSIAEEIRESGAIRGYDALGNLVVLAGEMKAVKAIGWYIEEYGKAQVSTNLTNIDITPMHMVFERVKEKAAGLGVEVTGSELVGLIPLRSLETSARFYCGKEGTITKDDLQVAIDRLGLAELKPFRLEERVIEYLL
ncbi:MAG: glutamate formimidoyltransferase [Flavobacteriales bacterium]|nr:glutamate formimidoyltransferase [Flavobacteriales bacterium]MCB9447622.1 glutamate formimidoyltransferase [Flavobacteriales bacterium]